MVFDNNKSPGALAPLLYRSAQLDFGNQKSLYQKLATAVELIDSGVRAGATFN